MVQMSAFWSLTLGRSVKTRFLPSGDHCGLPLRRPVAWLSVSQRIFDVQSGTDVQVAGTVARSTKVALGTVRVVSNTSRSLVRPLRAVDKSYTLISTSHGVSCRTCLPEGSYGTAPCAHPRCGCVGTSGSCGRLR